MSVYTLSTEIHSRSVDLQKLCEGIKYYIVHMYSMPYYTYGSTYVQYAILHLW